MVNKQHFLMKSELGIPKPQTPKENRINKEGGKGKGEGRGQRAPKSTATRR